MTYKLLEKKDLPYKKILVDNNFQVWQEIYNKTGKSTVPQIYINDKYIGGFQELNIAEISGELDLIINGPIKN